MVEFVNKEFVEQSTSRYKDLVSSEVKENESIKRMLTNLRERYKIVKIGDNEIRIRVAVPRNARDLASTLIGLSPEEYAEMGGLVGVTDKLYELAASMCLDPPFNDPATWYYLDENTDGVLAEIRGLLDASEDTDVKIHRFR
jgi:hypothetical protein